MFKEKGAFSGWKDVFYFTFRQGTKSKGFNGSTFGVAILFFLALLIVNVFMAYKSDEEVKSSPIEAVYIHNASGLEGLDFSGYLSGLEEEQAKGFKHIRFEEVEDLQDRLKETGTLNGKTVGIEITKKDKSYLLELWIPDNSEIQEKDGEGLLDILVNLLEQSKLVNSGISIEKLAIAKAPVQANFTNAGEDVETLGETLTKMLLPMFFCLIIYMMLIMYGQSIGQIVVVEKTSKLMEMLLTTIKPYAIIFGKILAMTVIAIMQTLIWIAGGVLGFVIGDKIANVINPGYQNMVKEIIGLIKISSEGQAFTPLTVVLALLVFFIGFLFYSVLAGLVASSISKSEDMANGMMLYQVVVIISFFVAYYSSYNEAGTLEGIARITPYIPFTAVLALPGDLLIGSRTLIQGWIGLVILIIATFLLVALTGKVYKDKVFHKGENLNFRFMQIFGKVSRKNE